MNWHLQNESEKVQRFVSDKFQCFDLSEVELSIFPVNKEMKLRCFSSSSASSIILNEETFKLFSHVFSPKDNFIKKCQSIADEFCIHYCIPQEDEIETDLTRLE